jgi:hypothetical protein
MLSHPTRPHRLLILLIPDRWQSSKLAFVTAFHDILVVVGEHSLWSLEYRSLLQLFLSEECLVGGLAFKLGAHGSTSWAFVHA